MSEKQPENLTGFWTGVYDYPRGKNEPVPFNAVIEDAEGSLSGEILEPNTFSPAKDGELFASLTGTRTGMNVHFIKTYEKVPRGGHSIVYSGTLDASFTRIDGTWQAPGSWSGPFVMNRSNGSKAAKEQALTDELELVKTK